MAKRKKADVVAEAVEQPCILVEGADGAEPYRVGVPAAVGKVRTVTVRGTVYEVCGLSGETWVYRAVKF